MNKQLKQFFTGTMIMLSVCGTKLAFAQAGERGGNGGDAVVCPDNKVTLLDNYEAQKRNMKIELPGSSLREKVNVVIKRMATVDNVNVDEVKKIADDMLDYFEGKPDAQHIIYMSTDELVDINDSLETSLPQGCELKQLVVNKKQVFAMDNKFEIRSDLWTFMDLDNQAMTITHEAIYNWLIGKGMKNSKFARYLNGYFSQTKINVTDYVADLTSNNLEYKVKANGLLSNEVIQIVKDENASEVFRGYVSGSNVKIPGIDLKKKVSDCDFKETFWQGQPCVAGKYAPSMEVHMSADGKLIRLGHSKAIKSVLLSNGQIVKKPKAVYFDLNQQIIFAK